MLRVLQPRSRSRRGRKARGRPRNEYNHAEASIGGRADDGTGSPKVMPVPDSRRYSDRPRSRRRRSFACRTGWIRRRASRTGITFGEPVPSSRSLHPEKKITLRLSRRVRMRGVGADRRRPLMESLRSGHGPATRQTTLPRPTYARSRSRCRRGTAGCGPHPLSPRHRPRSARSEGIDRGTGC